MSPDSSRLFRSLLEPCPNELTHSLLVISEEGLIAVDALKMTLGDLQDVRAKLQELVDEINAQPSSDEEN
jgi:hypothetical protein